MARVTGRRHGARNKQLETDRLRQSTQGWPLKPASSSLGPTHSLLDPGRSRSLAVSLPAWLTAQFGDLLENLLGGQLDSLDQINRI